MSFGTRLRARREELRITRAELARELGVSASAISNYENDLSFPKQEILTRLFEALAVEPNELYRDSVSASVFTLTRPERELLEKCRSLSATGRRAVYALVDTLCDFRDELIADGGEEPETRMIPLYRTPAAAGYASPVFGEDFDYVPVDETVPKSAEFGVRIQGDSMAPLIADGSVVYVSRDPMESGDVGIFCVDGDMLCKQYHRDALGMTYLFSLNRARSDADVVLGPGSGRTLACFGRVILPRRPPLPGR